MYVCVCARARTTTSERAKIIFIARNERFSYKTVKRYAVQRRCERGLPVDFYGLKKKKREADRISISIDDKRIARSSSVIEIFEIDQHNIVKQIKIEKPGVHKTVLSCLKQIRDSRTMFSSSVGLQIDDR